MGLTERMAQMLALNPNLFKRKNEGEGIAFSANGSGNLGGALPPRPAFDASQMPSISTAGLTYGGPSGIPMAPATRRDALGDVVGPQDQYYASNLQTVPPRPQVIDPGWAQPAPPARPTIAGGPGDPWEKNTMGGMPISALPPDMQRQYGIPQRGGGMSEDIPMNTVRTPVFNPSDPNASSSTANPDLPLPERDRLDAKANELRALISDPARKNDPLNKIPWWKRLLEGAFGAVQSAGAMAQQATMRGESMSGAGVLAGLGGGAVAGLAMPKGVADYRHRRELAGIQDQQGDIYEQQKRKDEEAQRILNRGLTESAIRENEAQARERDAKAAGGEDEDWQPWEGGGGRVFWKSKTGKLKPMIDPDTKQQMTKDDYILSPPDSNNIVHVMNRNTGKIVDKPTLTKPPEVDPVAKEQARIEREYEDANTKDQAALTAAQTEKRDAAEGYKAAQAVLQGLKDEDANPDGRKVSPGEISAATEEVRKYRRAEGEADAKISAANASMKSRKKPEPVKAVGDKSMPITRSGKSGVPPRVSVRQLNELLGP